MPDHPRRESHRERPAPLPPRARPIAMVNARVSKMGGLAIEVVSAARARGIPYRGRPSRETSLLTRAALVVAQAAGADLLAQEGPSGRSCSSATCEPSLMFGADGILDPRTYPFDTGGPAFPVALRCERGSRRRIRKRLRASLTD